LTTILLKELIQVPTAADISESHLAINKFIHRTPILQSESLNKIAGCTLLFKCENFQKVGAFKMRGATRAALALPPERIINGLATHSSGNHAQAVAKAAAILGVPAHIVMPLNAPMVKSEATKEYGAKIYPCEATFDARIEELKKVVANTGAHFIHPFDDYNVIAGQATCAKELIEDSGPLDIIIAPIGGGGLMSGTCLSAKYFSSKTKVFGAEPKEVDDAFRSIQTGILQINSTTNTIADGLKTSLSKKTFDIIQNHVEGILTVTETEIIAAMKLIWQRLKITAEPSSAVPLAAILKYPQHFTGKIVGFIISGGNVDIDLKQGL
jgi:threonine dehydratase